MERKPFSIHCFSLVICRHTDGRWLCVKETRNRGWWIPAGLVEPNEDFYSTAIRETQEEAGVDIDLKGVLRIENSFEGVTGRMRVIFFATSSSYNTKTVPDSESEGAAWLTIQEIKDLSKSKPGIRGNEIIKWPQYIENGGYIAPLSFFSKEGSSIELVLDSTRLINEEEDDIFNFKLFLINQNVDGVRKLLIKGIDPNTHINNKYWTGLHLAIKSNHIEMVRLLLLAGTSLAAVTHKGRNCLHFAVQSTFEIVSSIIHACLSIDSWQREQLVNLQDIYGDTSLHILARDMLSGKTKDSTIFDLLIKAGADGNHRNKEGVTPFGILNL